MIDTDKPKRKRKNGEGWSLRWLMAGALLLTVLALAGGFVYWSNPPFMPPSATDMAMPSPTPPFELPPQCDVTKTYQMALQARSGYYFGDVNRESVSPKQTYLVRYTTDGVYIGRMATPGESMRLMPAFANMYQHQMNWTNDEQRLAYLDGTRLMIAKGDGTDAKAVHDPVVEFRGWSPDGSSFLFSDGQVLWLATGDGTIQRPITEPAPENVYYAVYEWSPDSHYVIVYRNAADSSTFTIMPVDANAPVALKDIRVVYPSYIIFSPDERSVAYFTAKPDAPSDEILFGMAALDGSQHLEVALPGGTLLDYQPVLWSPDSQKLALMMSAPTGAGNNHATFSIYGLDGTELTSIGRNVLNYFYDMRFNGDTVPELQDIMWSPDSRTFTYLEAEGDKAALYVMDTMTGHIEQKLSDDIESLFYLPGSNSYLSYAVDPVLTLYHIQPDGSSALVTPSGMEHVARPFWGNDDRDMVAFKGWHGDKQAISIVRLLDDSLIDLVPDATTDAGDPSWSPHTKFVAAVYSDNALTDADRRVNLVWMDTKTGEKRTLSDDFLSVYDLAWSDDEQYLVYTAWRKRGTSLELLDTATGEHRVLLANADKIEPSQFRVEAGQARVGAVWSSGNTVQYQEFSPDGTAFTPFPLENGRLRRKIFWSPDSTIAAVKSIYKGPYSYATQDGPVSYTRELETLMLTRQDGTINVLASGLLGLGDPTWSPDGKLLAYTQLDANRVLSLHIADAEGHELWQSVLDTSYMFIWQAC